MLFEGLREKISKINPSKRLNKLNKEDLDIKPQLLFEGIQTLDRYVYIVEVSDGHCTYIYANEAGLQVLNINTSLLGVKLEDVLTDTSAQLLSQKYGEAVSTKNIIVFEDEMELKTGKKVVHETTLSPFFQQGKKYVMAIVRDITDRNLERDRLLRSKLNEQRLASFIENHLCGVVLLNNSGYILEVNNATESITGYPDHYLIGRHYTDIIADDEKDHVEEHFHHALLGSSINVETIAYHKNGKLVNLQLMKIPIIIDGEVQGMYLVVRDITEQKLFEEKAMRESTNYYAYLNNNPNSIVLLDQQHKVAFANKAFTDMYNFTKDEVMGADLPTIPVWLQQEADEMNKQVLENNNPLTIEYKRQKKSGEMLDIQATLFNLLDDQGYITRIAIVEKDITEAKRVLQLNQKERELYQYFWENTPDGICILGYDKTILRVNHKFEELLELDHEAMENKPFMNIHRQQHWDQVESVLEKIRESRSPVQLVTERNKTDGGILHLEVTYQPVLDDNLFAVVIYKDITSSVQELEEFKWKEEMYRTIVEQLPEAIVIHQHGEVRYINPGGLELLRAPGRAQVIGKSMREFVPLENQILVQSQLENHEEFSVQKMEKITRLDGTSIYAEATTVPINLKEETFVMVSIRDVTANHMAEKAMRESEERFQIIAENSVDIIKILNPKGTITYVSPAVEYILGYPVRDFVGKSFLDFVHTEDSDLLKEQFEGIKKTKEKLDIEARRIHQDGYSIWLHSNLVPILKEDGEIDKIVVISRDVSENKRKEAKLSKLAFYDALTGLPNRRLFEDRFEQATYTTNRTGKLTALMVLDCDHFKTINDTLGHDAGDEVIKEFAKRVGLALRKTDTLSRLGGDEFTIVLPEVGNEQDVVDIAERILDKIRFPMLIHEQELTLTASIGIALYPKDGPNYEEIFKIADNNLYKAKEQGKDTFVLDVEDLSSN